MASFGLEVKPFFESARPKPSAPVARWLLWIGAAGLLAAVMTGFLQPRKSVMFHDVSPSFSEHRFLGIWTVLVFFGISVGRFLAGRKPSALIALVWLSAFWILGAQILSGFRLSL